MERLIRTSYLDETGSARDGEVALREGHVDLTQYHRRLERAHGVSLHVSGVASGLQVRATSGASGLRVLPGAALAGSGDHLVLVAAGVAKLDDKVVPVAADGVTVPTSKPDGRYLLTIAWAETFDRLGHDLDGTYRVDHTPELRLRPAAESTPDTEVVLAGVTLAGGLVTKLDADDRRQCSAALTLHRARRTVAGAQLSVESETGGRLLVQPDAGLRLDATALALPPTLTIGGVTVTASAAGVPSTLSCDAARVTLGAAGAPALTVDGVTGNVGLGTPAPTARLDVAGTVAVDGLRAVSTSGGYLRLNQAGDYPKGVHTPHSFSAGSLNVGGVANWGDPGPGRLAVGGSVRVGGAVPGDAAAALVVDDSTADNTWNTAAFRKRSVGPHWSHIHWGEHGDWYIRSADDEGKVVLQDKGGNVGIGTIEPEARLHVAGDAAVEGTLAVRDLTIVGPEQGAALVVEVGNVGIGTDQTRRVLHVEGSEIHSGGSGGGFSFADRSHGELVDWPGSGERWVWYADGGVARLWSGGDVLSVAVSGEGGGLDVYRRMRVRQGNDSSAGIWFYQSGPQADRAFVGMASDSRVGFWGTGLGDWGLRMHTDSGNVGIGKNTTSNSRLSVDGGSNEFAAYFTGNVHVKGVLTKQGDSRFKIDHPLDPDRRYLSHSAVESDDMKNLYDGDVELDDTGSAEITVPAWWEALNTRFRYQLTAVGRPLPDLHIARELRDGRFTIAGGEPGSRVNWQVTGVRQDAHALANPLVVETDKDDDPSAWAA